jgi:hypothetical protein
VVAVPLSYIFEHETKNKKNNNKTKFKTSETVIMGRVFVVDSDREIEEDDVEDDDMYNQIGEMLDGI